MKVFVLVTEWDIDYDNGMQCIGVYETLEQATKSMNNDVECALKTVEFQDQIVDADADYVSVFANGDYTRNHMDWNIYEKEIIFNNEQQQSLQL